MAMPPEKTAEMRQAIEAKRRDRLIKDTYEVRMKEGRPNHTNASIFSIIIGILCWMITFATVVAPNWRTTYIGVIGYPHPRSWGLWYVSGKTTQGYYQQYSQTCLYYTQLNVGGICSSPICVWYRLKCQTYMQMAMMNYGVGIAFCFELVIYLLCLFWTCCLTPRLIRWAATWYPICVILHMCAWGIWAYLSDEEFSTLELKSYYPTPGLGASAYGSALAFLGLCFNMIMACQLYATWPEPDDDSDDDDDDDDDAYAQQQLAYQQQGYDPAYQQQGYDPAYQQQGYDPAYQQQGYDPAYQQQAGYAQQTTTTTTTTTAAYDPGYQQQGGHQQHPAPQPGAGAPAW